MEVPLRIKLIYTAVVFFLFLQLALRFGIVGPSLLDLKENFGVDYNDMSNSISIMCFGICVGAGSSGFINSYLSRELFASLLAFVTSFIVASITCLQNFELFLAANFAVGLTSGSAISLCESWILEIWGEQCGPYMQALQFFRGLGYIIAPLLVEPFLGSSTGKKVENANQTSSSTHFNSEIKIPYLLNSSMLMLAALMAFGLYLYNKCCLTQINSKSVSTVMIAESSNSISESSKKIEKEKNNEESSFTKQQNFFYYAMIILCMALYYFIYEEVIVTFLPSFATKIQLHLSKKEANLLTTAFNISSIVGKAISVLLAFKLGYVSMISINLTLMLSSTVLMIVYGEINLYALWIGTCLHGVGISSIIASMYTMMENAVPMNTFICGILNMSGTMGSVVLPLIIGPKMDTWPLIFLYSVLACIIACIVTFALMVSLIHFNQSRKQNELNQENLAHINHAFEKDTIKKLSVCSITSNISTKNQA